MAGIREARFAFPHYCHASNYAPSKATGTAGGDRDEKWAVGCRVVQGTTGVEGARRVAVAALAGSASPALRDSQSTGETRANKSPQLPPVRAICLDGRLMPDIIHPGNNTLLPNEV